MYIGALIYFPLSPPSPVLSPLPGKKEHSLSTDFSNIDKKLWNRIFRVRERERMSQWSHPGHIFQDIFPGKPFFLKSCPERNLFREKVVQEKYFPGKSCPKNSTGKNLSCKKFVPEKVVPKVVLEKNYSGKNCPWEKVSQRERERERERENPLIKKAPES